MTARAKLELYAQYDRDEALDALGVPKTPSYLGGAFFTDGARSAWFATVSERTDQPHFERADEFEWRMKPGGRFRRPPDEALGNIALLCRSEGEEAYTYLGQTKIHPAAWLREATMVLKPRLSTKQWKRWGTGSYQGWQVRIDGQLCSASDTHEQQRIVRSLHDVDLCEVSMSRPKGDWVFALLAKERGFVSVQPDELGWIAVEKPGTARGTSKGKASFRLANGEVDEIPVEQTVKRETAIAIIERILSGDDRPTIVRWRRP